MASSWTATATINGLPAVDLTVNNVTDEVNDSFSNWGDEGTNEGTNEKETQSQIIVCID
jgi:hypothetical protein